MSSSVSAVVASHNEGAQLELTVDSLLATLPPDGQVVVLDDASTDGSANLNGQGARLRVLRAPQRLGIAAARNRAAGQADGDVLVFCDAHMRFAPGWWEPLSEVLRRPDVGAASLAVSALGAPQCKGYGFTWKDSRMSVDWLPRRGGSAYPVPLLCGCFIAIRRPVFEASGGFDDGLVLWGFEDAELCMRLWTYGYRCLVLPHVEVEHLFRERFPYPVDSAVNIHNLLRVAVVHLAEARIARLTAELATNQHFPAALARVLESDVWARRQCVRRERTFDDGWFLGQFGITVFDRA